MVPKWVLKIRPGQNNSRVYWKYLEKRKPADSGHFAFDFTERIFIRMPYKNNILLTST